MVETVIQSSVVGKLTDAVEVDCSPGHNAIKGLATLLRHGGCQTDYTTIMGDIGQAFIFQGTEYDERLTGGYADLGWWPWDRWHIGSRLQFLSWITGAQIRHYEVDFSELDPNPEKTYTELFQTAICEEVDAGRVCLAFWDFCHVVTGYDGNKPPLLGWDLTHYTPQKKRMDHYPCAIITCYATSDPLDRIAADRLALHHAVELGRGKVKAGSWVTGPLAWQGWQDHLVKRTTEHYWHGNIKENLKLQRSAAVTYLESMASRHGGATARALCNAADVYRQQLVVIEHMPTGWEVSAPGMEQSELLDRIGEAAMLDREAVGYLESALERIGK